MKISKKYKKQAKSNIKNSTSRSELARPKMKWNVKVGDLVSIDDDNHGIVLKDSSKGQFLILSSTGTRWFSGKKVLKVQAAPSFSGACKKEK